MEWSIDYKSGELVFDNVQTQEAGWLIFALYNSHYQLEVIKKHDFFFIFIKRGVKTVRFVQVRNPLKLQSEVKYAVNLIEYWLRTQLSKGLQK